MSSRQERRRRSPTAALGSESVSKLRNPTHGSGWMLQIQPTSASTDLPGIPPTGVGGWFKSSLFPLTFEHSRRDLNNPPTPVGGI
jgi:hypothetical protein